MSYIWTNSSGQILMDDDGKILSCDECPCESGCNGWASSYTVVKTGSQAFGPIIMAATQPVSPGGALVSGCPSVTNPSSDCWWLGPTLGSAPGTTRATLQSTPSGAVWTFFCQQWILTCTANVAGSSTGTHPTANAYTNDFFIT
jgi:hypothetical protein